MPNFLIRRSTPGTISGILPATEMPMGKALYISAKDADTGENTFALASGRADGFVTREVREDVGSTDAELVDKSMGLALFEMPFQVSKPGSIEFADALEVEGSDFIFGSGTGEVTADTAAGTKLSFVSGKFYVAQAGDYAQYILVKQMTPETEGDTRIYVEKIHGYVVPA
jgi:hypothetical protein